MKIRVIVVVLTILFGEQLQASDAATRGQELIEQASKKMNIFELPSFRMNADVHVDNFGKPLDGKYSLLWNGPGQWREEVMFPGYSEIQVGNKGTNYLSRSTSQMLYRVFQLHSALGFGSVGLPRTSFVNQGLPAGETIKAVHQKTLGGQKADCVEIIMESKHPREVCVDPKTGVLSRTGQHLVDSDFFAVSEKLFPRSLVLEQEGKRVVEVHVTELKTSEQFQSTLFQPLQDSMSRQGCMNPTPGPKLKEVVPVYPSQDKMSRNQGMVGIYAIIDENGAPKELQKVMSASPGLDKSATDAIGKWRYAPATCDGKPIAIETVIEISYTLQY